MVCPLKIYWRRRLLFLLGLGRLLLFFLDVIVFCTVSFGLRFVTGAFYVIGLFSSSVSLLLNSRSPLASVVVAAPPEDESLSVGEPSQKTTLQRMLVRKNMQSEHRPVFLKESQLTIRLAVVVIVLVP